MKIAVCVPCHGHPKFEFVASLAALLIHSEQELVYLTVESADLPRNRNQLAHEALKRDVDFILWLDADHTFPADSLDRLLAHDLDAVGANYPMRGDGLTPSATGLDGARVVPKSGLEEVATIGFGVCLIRAAVMKQLKAPWFIGGSEDMYFFANVRRAGFKVHVDHSLEVGHVTETVLHFPR